MGRLATARKQEINDGATKGEEPDDKSPDDFLANGPILLDEADERKHSEQQVQHTEDGERAIGPAAASTGSKQGGGKNAQQEGQRGDSIAKGGEKLHFRLG